MALRRLYTCLLSSVKSLGISARVYFHIDHNIFKNISIFHLDHLDYCLLKVLPCHFRVCICVYTLICFKKPPKDILFNLYAVLYYSLI